MRIRWSGAGQNDQKGEHFVIILFTPKADISGGDRLGGLVPSVVNRKF